MKKWVYLIDEVDEVEAYVGGDWENVRGLLGGKGANMAEMVRIGIPVPPGFTVTTEACNAYLASGDAFSKGMKEQMIEALKAIEETTGKKFGDLKNPLLISCRNGAKCAEPRVMEKMLGVGGNDEKNLDIGRRTIKRDSVIKNSLETLKDDFPFDVQKNTILKPPIKKNKKKFNKLGLNNKLHQNNFRKVKISK